MKLAHPSSAEGGLFNKAFSAGHGTVVNSLTRVTAKNLFRWAGYRDPSQSRQKC